MKCGEPWLACRLVGAVGGAGVGRLAQSRGQLVVAAVGVAVVAPRGHGLHDPTRDQAVMPRS